MKQISITRFSYLISLTLHLSVLVYFVYLSFEPKSYNRSYQTSVFFESSAVLSKSDKSSQKSTASKPFAAVSPSNKLNLVPGINKKTTVVPETEPFQAPSLKKYITPPKTAVFQTDEPAGFLRSNKRTERPVLPTIPAIEPPDIQQTTAPSSTTPAGSEKAGSRGGASKSNQPYLPDPSSIKSDVNKTASSRSKVSAIWQKKTDLLVYRNSLAKLVTANWIVPHTSIKKFQILIAAHINPQGNVISILPIKQSGLAILDAAAERAIRVSTPFPEFPKSFKKDLRSYRAVFRFTPDKVAN
jgi:hypothetical protein